MPHRSAAPHVLEFERRGVAQPASAPALGAPPPLPRAPSCQSCFHCFQQFGFTKKSAEDFFTKLCLAGVKRLLDVRLNNVSQLADFSKRDDLRYFLKAISLGAIFSTRRSDIRLRNWLSYFGQPRALFLYSSSIDCVGAVPVGARTRSCRICSMVRACSAAKISRTIAIDGV